MQQNSETKRDPRVNPIQGDVLENRGVTRTALEVTHRSVQSLFTSPRWRHTEWAPIETWRKWAKGATVITHAAE